jgi:outer membrane protein TolC
MKANLGTVPAVSILGLGLALQSAWAQTPAAAPLTLTLQDAMERARVNSPLLLTANLAALIAREDTVQAKAALFPMVSAVSQYIRTEPNGLPSGVFVSNDGPNIYNNLAVVHGDLFAPGKLADYRKTRLAEAVARARADIAARGLIATVFQNYYGMVSAMRKLANAKKSEQEAGQLVDITEKQERGGEVAHADSVKARIQLVQRQRDAQEAALAIEKARLAFAVLLFPDFRQDFSVVDDLASTRSLPAFAEIQSLASNPPDIRAAKAAVDEQGFGVKSARAARLPNLTFDVFYGMNSTEFALHTPEGFRNLGYAAQAQLNVPLWTWGATTSRIKQAELRLQQARNELSLTRREFLTSLNSFYLEAAAASAQIGSLRESEELSAESLRLTLLRYQAGEATVLEVVDAQTTLALARNAHDDGVVRYRLSLANLQTLTGEF